MRLASIWPEENSSSVDFANIFSAAPTDFHPANAQILYFTKQYDLAYRHALYDADVKHPVPHGILYVAVPHHIMQDATPIFGADFQQLVWDSRRDNPRQEIAESVRHYTQAPLLVGPVCGDSTEEIRRRCRQPGDIEHPVLESGELAQQYAWQGLPVADRLSCDCEVLIWLQEMHCRGWGRWRSRP